MSKIKWDQTGERQFETGVSSGAFYPQNSTGAYAVGYAWNGLTAVSEKPSGAEASPLYADNIQYLNLMSAEKFGATVEAFMYPEEFMECDGSAEIAAGITIGQQNRKAFGLAYKTLIGNDIDGQDHGYKLHLVYGCLAAPSEKNFQTVNENPEALTFSWELSTTPVDVTVTKGGTSVVKKTATLTIDSTKVDAAKLAELELELFGRDRVESATTPVTEIIAHLLLPDEVAAIFAA